MFRAISATRLAHNHMAAMWNSTTCSNIWDPVQAPLPEDSCLHCSCHSWRILPLLCAMPRALDCLTASHIWKHEVTLSGGPADRTVAMAACAAEGANVAAAVAAALCLCLARCFVREPRLSPREPKASMLRFRHLSCKEGVLH